MNKKILLSMTAAAAVLLTACSGGAQQAQKDLTSAAETMKNIQAVNQVSTLDIKIVQEDAPQVSFFGKVITADYTDTGANGVVMLEGSQLGEKQNIEVVFKDGLMYQNIDGARYVPLEEESITAANADMLQLYSYKLPAKLMEYKDSLQDLSSKEQDGASVIACKLGGEEARGFAQYFFIDFMLGDEEVLAQNQADMLENMKMQRDALPEEERAQYSDEKLQEMVTQQMEAYKQNYMNLFEAITVENIRYEGKMENGFLTEQKVEADASYRGQNYHLVFTDSQTNINGEVSMENMPELTEENTITMEQYQQEMMMMQMFMQQMQQAAQ